MNLLPGQYWHLTTPNSILLHNAFLAKGVVPSISLIARGNLEQATTLYTAANNEVDKEAAFEQIRAEHYPHLPSRLKAFFCFASEGAMRTALEEWFEGDDRIPLVLSIIDGSATHIADSKLLNAEREHWPDAAHAYWRGEATDHPLFEVIVHGAVYFPEWETEPFGMMQP